MVEGFFFFSFSGDHASPLTLISAQALKDWKGAACPLPLALNVIRILNDSFPSEAYKTRTLRELWLI